MQVEFKGLFRGTDLKIFYHLTQYRLVKSKNKSKLRKQVHLSLVLSDKGWKTSKRPFIHVMSFLTILTRGRVSLYLKATFVVVRLDFIFSCFPQCFIIVFIYYFPRKQIKYFIQLIKLLNPCNEFILCVFK